MQLLSPAGAVRNRLMIDQYGSYDGIFAACTYDVVTGVHTGAGLDARRQQQYDDWCMHNWNIMWRSDKTPRLEAKYRAWKRGNKPTLFQRFIDALHQKATKNK